MNFTSSETADNVSENESQGAGTFYRQSKVVGGGEVWFLMGLVQTQVVKGLQGPEIYLFWINFESNNCLDYNPVQESTL